MNRKENLYPRKCFQQTDKRWKKLQEIAKRHGATIKSGAYAGDPSISVLLRMIADGELIVVSTMDKSP